MDDHLPIAALQELVTQFIEGGSEDSDGEEIDDTGQLA